MIRLVKQAAASNMAAAAKFTWFHDPAAAAGRRSQRKV